MEARADTVTVTLPDGSRRSIPRGTTVRVRCEGKNLDDITEIALSQAGVVAKAAPQAPSGGVLALDVHIPTETPAGVYRLTLKNSAGMSKPVAFTVDYFAAIAEQEANDSPAMGQKITLPATVAA